MAQKGIEKHSQHSIQRSEAMGSPVGALEPSAVKQVALPNHYETIYCRIRLIALEIFNELVPAPYPQLTLNALDCTARNDPAICFLRYLTIDCFRKLTNAREIDLRTFASVLPPSKYLWAKSTRELSVAIRKDKVIPRRAENGSLYYTPAIQLISTLAERIGTEELFQTVLEKRRYPPLSAKLGLTNEMLARAAFNRTSNDLIYLILTYTDRLTSWGITREKLLYRGHCLRLTLIRSFIYIIQKTVLKIPPHQLAEMWHMERSLMLRRIDSCLTLIRCRHRFSEVWTANELCIILIDRITSDGSWERCARGVNANALKLAFGIQEEQEPRSKVKRAPVRRIDPRDLPMQASVVFRPVMPAIDVSPTPPDFPQLHDPAIGPMPGFGFGESPPEII